MQWRGGDSGDRCKADRFGPSGRCDMTRIVLGDDHAVFVESLVSVLIRAGFRVPAVARSLAGTIEAVRHHRPDVCLLSRRFSDGDGVAAISHVIAVSPSTRILMLTADRDTDAMRHAVRLGAAGYVDKTWGIRKLVQALQRVVDGAVVLDAPASSRRGTTSARSDISEARRLAAHLTARERECLALLVEGLDTRAMTLRLGVSTTTVRSHVQALLTKLGVHSRLEAATFAVRYDLVDHDQHDPNGRTKTG
ncbi:MAG: response regulator [Pseudonocardiaceae bacterium]